MTTPRLMFVVLGAFVTAAWIPAGARTALLACSAAESRQFDFWIGEWDLERSDGARARVRVTRTHDGCVIQEDFDASPAMPLTGRSIASWDPATRGWKQTWVDNHGSFFSFTGGFENGRMTLTASYVNAGKASLHRRVWSSITPDSFEWDWVTSDDEGRTWRSAWKFTGRRVPPSSASSAPSAVRRDSAPSAPSAISRLAWLEGRWDGTLPNGMKADITYTDARAGHIAATMRLHDSTGTRLVMGEIILLSETPDGMIMRAHHFSPELRIGEDTAMTMRYSGGSADSLHFESIAGQKVDAMYLRRGADAHIARSVVHRPDGRHQIIEMTYRRRR